MGVSLSGNYKNAIELSGSYSLMYKIRSVIAYAFDQEFGKCYDEYYQSFGESDERHELAAKLEKILEDSRFKEEDNDILDFLFASDAEGKLPYKTCKKIYELIKDNNNDYQLRYGYYSNNDWQDFKELLLQCYKHRSYLVWN